MIRRMIQIDQQKCNGCGLCVTACHEGAIALIGGKAYLARENFCDGFRGHHLCRAGGPGLR